MLHPQSRARRLGATALVSVSIAATATAQAPLFPGRHYQTDAFPVGITAGDVDGDGTLELVTVESTGPGTGQIAIREPDGAGGLLAPLTRSINGNHEHVAFGDMNGDGVPEIVVAEDQDTKFRVYHSSGTGGYVGSVTRTVPGSIVGVTVGDADGDGLTDVVTLESGPNAYRISHGNGSGGFMGAATAVPLASTFQAAMGIRDLNNDTVPDLAMISWTAGLQVFLGDGLGGHTAGVTVPTANQTSSIDFGDFDEDGNVDIATSGTLTGGARVEVSFGNGAGGFSAFTELLVDGGRRNILVADFDDDGHLDIASADDGSEGGVHVAYGDGSGGFAPEVVHLVRVAEVGTWRGPRFVLADVDGDGDADLVTLGTAAAQHVAVLLKNDDGSFYEPIAAEIGPFSDVALADLNGDGHPDAVEPEVELGVGVDEMRVHLGDGTGGFVASIASQPVPIRSNYTRLADFDGDGETDVVVSTEDVSLSVLLGDGLGGLGTATTYAAALPEDALELDVEVADVDLDGDIDVVAVAHHGTFPNDVGGYAVWPGNGDGSLGAPLSGSIVVRTESLELADMTLDGIPDMVTSTGSQISIWVGDGVGEFAAAPASTTTAFALSDLIVAELTGDGLLDVGTYTSSTSGGTVRVLAGDGAGSLGRPNVIPTDSLNTGGALRVADVDSDGNIDLVAGGWIFRGDGAGTFGNPEVYRAHGLLDLLDVDGDGRVDIVQRGVTTLLNEPSLPIGIATYGTGTPGCRGTTTLTTREVPSVNNQDFGLAATNAPAYVPTLLILSGNDDPAGTIGLDVLFHIDVVTAPFLFTEVAQTDAGGTSYAAVPIPDDPFLGGLVVYAQAFQAWPSTDACDPSSMGLSSSRAITITVQP